MIRLLNGVRVVECAALLCGPTLSSFLADLGADVIKVESPPLGDYMRDIMGAVGPRESPAHLQINKNKRSISLDLRQSEGREVFFRLLDSADIFIDGFMAGACDRLGIGYEVQRQRKPDIIYCQYTGYGAAGPYAGIPTHGRMMNAAAGSFPIGVREDGLIASVDEADGGLGGSQDAGEATAMGGIYGALSVTAALVRRQSTGEGCYIDISATDAAIASSFLGVVYAANADLVTWSAMPHAAEGAQKLVEPPPARALEGARYYFYEAEDHKFVLFGAMELKWWKRFCELVGREDLLKDHEEAFDAATGDRELYFELRKVFLERTQSQWLEFAEEHDLPIGPAYTRVRDVMGDDQLQGRDVFIEGKTPGGVPFVYVGWPGLISGQSYDVYRLAPSVGEHSREILREIGIPESEADHLQALGVI